MDHFYLASLPEAARQRAMQLLQTHDLLTDDDHTKGRAVEQFAARPGGGWSLPLLHVLAYSPLVVWRDAGLIPWESLGELILREQSHSDAAVCRAYAKLASSVPLTAETATMLSEMLFVVPDDVAVEIRRALLSAATDYAQLVQKLPSSSVVRSTPETGDAYTYSEHTNTFVVGGTTLQDKATVSLALQRGVELYATHHNTAPLEAALIVSPQNATMVEHIFSVVWSHRQDPPIAALFTEGGHDACFYLLLLATFVAPSHTPTSPHIAAIDDEIRHIDNPDFAQRFLDVITAIPDATMRRHLEEFQSLPWLTPDNPHLPDIVDSRELPFLQIVFCMTLSVSGRQELLRWGLTRFSSEGRISILKRLSSLPELSAFSLLLDLVSDADPSVCAQALRQIYALKGAEVDYVFLRHLRTHSTEIREAIYDLKPEFRVRSLLQQALNDPKFNDPQLAHIVANIDHETPSVLESALRQPQAVYRVAALRTAAMAGLLQSLEPAITPLATDSSFDVRATLAMILQRQRPTDSVIAVLQQLAHDGDRRVSSIAIDALATVRKG
ncbi:MAG: HEAT repeat domain-containing protein [Thermoguttaceae bacterium]